MKLERTLLIGGIWIAVLPYLGFPYSWKNILFTISGLVLVYISYTLYQKEKADHEEKAADNFSENIDFIETIETEVYEEAKN